MTKRRGNGEGSIYQRKDGRWTASYTVGQGKRRHLFAKTRQEVARKLTAALRDQQQGLPPVNGKQTVSRYLDFWLVSVKGSIRPRTFESYDLNVRRLKPGIGSYRLSALKPAAIEAATPR